MRVRLASTSEAAVAAGKSSCPESVSPLAIE
jgi:hypothetical protein